MLFCGTVAFFIDDGILQVTWDDKSLFVNGERIMLFSGEIHPFRYVDLNWHVSCRISSN